MKKLVFVGFLFFASCDKPTPYTVDIVYMNGDKETIEVVWKGCGCAEPYLEEGCLYVSGYRVVRCGIRSINMKKIENQHETK